MALLTAGRSDAEPAATGCWGNAARGASAAGCRWARAGARALARLLITLALAGSWPAEASGQQTSPNGLKALFLFHFTKFVEWPPTAFSGPEAPLTIGILGADPFGPALDDVVRDEVVNRRRLAVQRYRDVKEIKDCHVLYISSSENAALDAIVAALKGRPILLVGEAPDFARRGGMVQFVTERTVRLRINVRAAKAAGLTISSRLLRLAEVVE